MVTLLSGTLGAHAVHDGITEDLHGAAKGDLACGTLSGEQAKRRIEG